MSISLYVEEIDFEVINERELIEWLSNIINFHSKSLENINYIFCSDDYLLEINQQFLNHDFYTDILTFDSSEEPEKIEADIFISIERVYENAKLNNSTFQDELHRVMAHGLLHLIGYDDKTDEEKKVMREKETWCLSLRNLTFHVKH